MDFYENHICSFGFGMRLRDNKLKVKWEILWLITTGFFGFSVTNIQRSLNHLCFDFDENVLEILMCITYAKQLSVCFLQCTILFTVLFLQY